MLMWHKRLWLIDHGATLYFHHSPGWEADLARARDPFPMIKKHVLLGGAGMLTSIDDAMAQVLQPEVLAEIAGWIPASWLAAEPGTDAEVSRAAYVRHFVERLRAPRPFVEEAVGAR